MTDDPVAAGTNRQTAGGGAQCRRDLVSNFEADSKRTVSPASQFALASQQEDLRILDIATTPDIAIPAGPDRCSAPVEASTIRVNLCPSAVGFRSFGYLLRRFQAQNGPQTSQPDAI
jgi:hypothetical protein